MHASQLAAQCVEEETGDYQGEFQRLLLFSHSHGRSPQCLPFRLQHSVDKSQEDTSKMEFQHLLLFCHWHGRTFVLALAAVVPLMHIIFSRQP